MTIAKYIHGSSALRWRTAIFTICAALWLWAGCDMVSAGEKLSLNSPRLSPDGQAIIFWFGDGTYNSKIAVLDPRDPNSKIVFMMAPPTLNWIEPDWSPDMRYIAAASYCAENDNCFEGATGYNIWRFSTRNNEFVKLTENNPRLHRAAPTFDDKNNVYYIARSISPSPAPKRAHGDPFVYKLDEQQDRLLFPREKDTSHSNWKTSNFSLYGLSSPKPLPNGDFLFVSIVTDKGFYERAIKPTGIDKISAVLLRYSGGEYSLEKKFSVTGLAISSGQQATKFFTVPHVKGTKLVSYRVYAESDMTNPVLEFPGTYFTNLTVTADGTKFAFFGNVDSGSERDIWTYDATTKEMRRLNIGTRLKQAVLADPELGRSH